MTPAEGVILGAVSGDGLRTPLGTAESSPVGIVLGLIEGIALRSDEGSRDGDTITTSMGINDGSAPGLDVGSNESALTYDEGVKLGEFSGDELNNLLGFIDSNSDGKRLVPYEGITLRPNDGRFEGKPATRPVGTDDGATLGLDVGSIETTTVGTKLLPGKGITLRLVDGDNDAWPDGSNEPITDGTKL